MITDEDDDGYDVAPADLEHLDAQRRQSAVISISRKRIAGHEARLLKMLESDPDVSVRRHVVRALANLGVAEAVPPIRRIAESGEGLIAGDAARALGQLRANDAGELLNRLTQSPVDWVRNSARWALKQIELDSAGQTRIE